MLNFEEELKKFKPCLEVEEVEESIYSDEVQDMMDILQSMIKRMNENRKME